MGRCRSFCRTVLIGLAISLYSPLTLQAQNEEASQLEVGKLIERRLGQGEIHRYALTLEPGYYLRVRIVRIDIGVVATLFDPDGKRLNEASTLNSVWRTVFISSLAERAGVHLLELRAHESSRAGPYEIKLEHLQTARAEDRSRLAADQSLQEGLLIVARGLEQRRQKREKYEQALSLFREADDRDGMALALALLGETYRGASGEKAKAIDCFDQALALWRALGNRRAEAQTLVNLGMLFGAGEGPKAMEAYRQALAIWEGRGDGRMAALTLENLGHLYRDLGERQEALDHFNRALFVRRTIKDQAGEAGTLEVLARFFMGQGDYQQGLNHFSRALALWRAAGNRGGEGNCLNSIGGLYLGLGEYRQALDYYNRALSLFRDLAHRRPEVGELNNIAYTHLLLGEKEQAIKYYEEALSVSRVLGDPGVEAQMNFTLAGAYRRLGEHEKAIDYYHRSLAFPNQMVDRHSQVTKLVGLGLAYHGAGQKQKALDTINEALALWPTRDDLASQATILSSIGGAYAALGDREKALELLNQTLSIWRAYGDLRGEADTLHTIARLEYGRGNLDKARADLEAALDFYEAIRTRIGSQELRASYFATVQRAYQLYIGLLMRLHHQRPSENFDAAALQASERARARSLLDLLSEARAEIRQGADLTLLTRERSLQQQINHQTAQLQQLLSNKSTSPQAETVAKELRRLTTELQEVEAQIRISSPRYAALTRPVPLSLSEIQQQVLGSDQILLEYALGDEQSYLWVVTRNRLTSYQLPRRAEIDKAARHVYDLLSARQRRSDEDDRVYKSRVARAEAEYWPAAAALSRMLLAPAAAHLDAKRLLIVADGSLLYIPFAALPAPSGSTPESGPAEFQLSPQPRPLMMDHEIVVLPSASTLGLLRRETARRVPAAKALAVLADPVFTPSDPRIKAQGRTFATFAEDDSRHTDPYHLARALREVGLIGEKGELSRLPFTREEAAAILALVPADKSMGALDFKASRAVATSAELSQYRIVHFATHGLLNAENPALSGLVFSLVDERGRPQDGFLGLHEIYNLNLPAELVVLSACQTGLGKEVRGEGFVGMTRGFMYAGTKRVMASLWKVSDSVTAEMMKRFYGEMLEKGRSPAAALRAAQMRIWGRRQWRSPYFWAAFVLLGEAD